MNLKELLAPELFEQVQAAIDAKNAGEPDKTKHIRFADLSEGGYVAVDKYNNKVNTLQQQVNGLQDQITQRDKDMVDLNGKLAAAQADAGKLGEAQTALTTLQQKYDTDRQTWESKNKQQQYEFMVREKASGLQFSSPAAKRDFIREANGKDFKVDGETLLGYEDFVTKYKAENPGALVEPKPDDGSGEGGEATPKQPTIVLPKNPQPTGDKAVFGFKFNGVRPKPSDN